MKKIYIFLFSMLSLIVGSFAQTTLISATGDGGFENGSTLAANNWLVANSSTDQWTVGTAPGVFAGTNAAYVSTSVAGTWTYSQLSVIQHLYRDITIPAGESVATLNFKWKALGEGTTTSDWDNMKIFLAPTSVTPAANIAILATYQISGPGAISGMYKLNSASYNDETISAGVTGGVTYRLIFSWKSDVSDLAPPPAAIDNISLITRTANSISSTAIGGLWSSPATWVGGVVPSGDDAVIADGAIVTIDQVVSVRDLTVGGGSSGILQWNGTANALTATRNVLVNSGANLNMFIAAAAHAGVQINVGGNFTNNGTVHVAMFAGIINFNSVTSSTPSNLDGSGTFVGGIIGQLQNQSTGGLTINTTQNIRTRTVFHTAGPLNTNGKLSIDNTAVLFGASFHQKIYNIAVTAMGTGYNSATPPTITIANPNAGVTATATPNIDDATGTLRSITITNAGDGYTFNPVVSISGVVGSGAAAIAVNNRFSSGATNSTVLKSGVATITGGINIRSEQAVGSVASATALGAGYTSAPSIGFGLPFGYQNLVTSGGSGYTSLPTITVSGGTSLTGVTNPTFTVIVAQGKVVSVIASAGGTLWTSPPTLTVTGGGGSGATAAYATNCLATATATIANGAVNSYTLTNGGFGYTAAPTVSLVGGGFTTAATAFSGVALYNLTLNFFAPAPSNAPHSETGLMPTNRRINVLSVTNAVAGSAFTGDVEIYAAAPLTLSNSLLSFGSNTLFASHPTYSGNSTGSLTNNISGNIRLSTPGGSLTRTFPFDAPFVAVMGTGSLATGSTVTSITASRTGAPSGTVSPSGNTTGTRAYRIVTNAGATYGTNPTVTMNYNANDALVADNPTLFIGQSASLSGPWTNRSVSSGTGGLSAIGTRTTATTAPGPIVPTGDDYYAWTTTFVLPSCAVPTAVAASAVTASSATISFTSAGSAFIVEYGPSGFTPGLGATAGSANSSIVTSASSPVNLSGLFGTTPYDVYIRQNCTAASLGYSPNSNVISFATSFDCTNNPVIGCNSPTSFTIPAGTGLYSTYPSSGGTFATPGFEKMFKFTATFTGLHQIQTTAVANTIYVDYFFKAAGGACDNTGWTFINDINTLTTTTSTTFILTAGTTYLILLDPESSSTLASQTFQIVCPSACPSPTSVGTNSVSSTTANVTFTGAGTSYIVEYGPTGFTPGTGLTAGSGSSFIATGATSPISLSGLTPSTAYQVYVRQDCTGAGNGFSLNSSVISFTTLAPPPANDLPAGAISLSVNGGCTGNPYDNSSATHSVNEPYTSCEGTTGYASVWYKFVAPTSGSVKVSCDGTGTLGDTRMALFSTTDVNDFSRFDIITCDDDNGVIGVNRSLFYTSGLTAGSTYYVIVDLYSSFGTKGTFCLTVDELTSAMITTTAADCSSDQGVAGLNATYRGWSSMVDVTGNLSANVRQNTGTATGFSCSRTIKTGAPRTVFGVPYMNRNFSINGSGATLADVQFYFTDAELTNLGSTLAALQVSRVPGSTCNADFAGLDSVLTQGLNGSGNGVNFIQVPTPGFSNFYIRGAGGVLPVTIEFFRGSKLASANYLEWKVTCTSEPSVFMSLERSADGRSFTSIQDQTATATRCLQRFNYTDNTPLAGYNYYRLKTVTPDGKVVYSTIVVLLNKDKGFELISLAPNPVKNNAILSLTTVKGGKIEISVSDVAGKVISKQSTIVIAGNNPINMNFANLSAGTYIITAINAEGELKTTRFVKF